MKNVVWIFLGSGLGGLVRYTLAIGLHSFHYILPIHTLIANGIASFILGICMGFLSNHSELSFIKFGIAIGFCGGLSTFSTFSYELFGQASQNEWIQFILYSSLSLITCLALTAIGFHLTKSF